MAGKWQVFQVFCKTKETNAGGLLSRIVQVTPMRAGIVVDCAVISFINGFNYGSGTPMLA